MPILHTLRLKNRLTQHGMPDDQAQDLVDELDDALTHAVSAQVATKADIASFQGEVQTSETLRGDVKADLESVQVVALAARVTMIQWGMGLLVTAMLIGSGPVDIHARTKYRQFRQSY